MVAAHETLSTNDSFKLFLQQEEEVFAETLADTAEPPVEKVKQALSWVDVRVALAWKLLTEKKLLGYEEGEEAPQEEPSPCDAMMMAPEQYIMEVDGKLTALKNAITYMVSKSKDANDKLAEFSDAAHELGEFEDSADLKNLSSATESLTVCTKDYFDKVEANFIGPLDELTIHVWRNPELGAEKIQVRPDGRITIPLVKDMPAVGKTPAMLQQTGCPDIVGGTAFAPDVATCNGRAS